MNSFNVSNKFEVGGSNNKVAVIAGPCVIESRELVLEVAGKLKEICSKYNIPLIFKSSYDKANRTSIESFRGPGLEKGLQILSDVKDQFKLPVTSDVHEPNQAKPASEVLDIIQIPAFLCRQTDLLIEAGKTGKVINVKKGQFLDAEGMEFVANKVSSTGNKKIMLTERGTTFGYNNLVVDMRNIPKMKSLGFPVVFDGTHSVQEPGGGATTGGNRDFVPYLTRAAISVGIDLLFLEVHPQPSKGLSDAANMIDYDMFEQLMKFLANFEYS